MSILTEVGVTDDANCLYCGYPEAAEDYDSGGIFEAELNGVTICGYDSKLCCPLCGWTLVFHQGDFDDLYVKNSKKAKTIDEIEIPDEIEVLKPAKAIVAMAKKIIKEIYDPLMDNSSYMNDAIIFELNLPAENDVEQKEKLSTIKNAILISIFKY